MIKFEDDISDLCEYEPSGIRDGAAYMEGVDLHSWFKRPIKIASYTLAEGANLYQTLFPWQLYFSNNTVNNKLLGYAFLRAKLHVKVVCNCGPFRYTYGMMSYLPLCGDDADILPSSGADYQTDTIWLAAQTLGNIGRSQRMRAFFAPQANMGCEMVLPFISHKDFIDLRESTYVASELKNMGRLTLETFFPLQTATTAVSDVINFNIYAWCDEIDLAGPSLNFQGPLEFQGPDEYSEGVISAPASAMAKYTSAMGDIPIIGKYARATTLALSGVSSFARAFGFTNPPVINDTMPMKPSFLNCMASPDISVPVEKLTLDPKNELSVDPRIFGCDGQDELSLAYFAKKESYMGLVPWQTTATTGTALISAYVTPDLWAGTVRETGTVKYRYATATCAPMTWAIQPFTYWRGSIKYRFVVVASPFHKGRVKFMYDPAGPFGASVDEGRVMTHIIDISETTEFEMEIPYCQPHHWCNTGGITGAFGSISATTALGDSTYNYGFPGSLPTYNYLFNNGYFRVEVVTELGAGTVSSPAYILMFVSFGDDFEVALPSEVEGALSGVTQPKPLSYLPPLGFQGPEVLVEQDVPNEEPTCLCPEIKMARPTESLVFMGERVLSVRQLMHRGCFYSTLVLSQGIMNNNFTNIASFSMPKFPRTPGCVPTTVSIGTAPTAISSVNTGTNPRFNFVRFNPLSYYSPAFTGYRGSIVWKFLPINQQNVCSSEVRVTSIIHSTSDYAHLADDKPATLVQLDGTKKNGYNNRLVAPVYGNSMSATSVVPGTVMPTCEVLIPTYNMYRFAPTNPLNPDGAIFLKANTQRRCQNAMRVTITQALAANYTGADFANVAESIFLNTFCHAGPDFSLGGFQNVPKMYYTNILPTSD